MCLKSAVAQEAGRRGPGSRPGQAGGRPEAAQGPSGGKHRQADANIGAACENISIAVVLFLNVRAPEKVSWQMVFNEIVIPLEAFRVR